MSEIKKEGEKKEGVPVKEDFCLFKNGGKNGQSESETRGRETKIVNPEIIMVQAARKGSVIEALRRLNAIGIEDEWETPERSGEIPEKYIISTRVLIFILLLLGGAIGGTYYFDMKRNERLKAACELLQKGQPLPDSLNEIQMPDADSLYKLVEICEQNHNVDITYGCAAEGVLRTAGLNHEPSEISEELGKEALRVAEEVKCNQ